MNIINYVQAQIHHLQENECKVVHSEYSTYMCIGVEKYKKLHYLLLPGSLEEAVKFLFHFV